MKKRIVPTVYLPLFIILTAAACTPESESLSVGMMPAVDIAPFYYALDEGLYEQHGLDIELVLFTNAQNRQTALQTGQIDGAMTDLVALVTNAAGDFPLRGTLSTEGVFPLLVRSVDDLTGTNTSIGMMEISVTNYIAQQYIAEHYTNMEYEAVYINEIPARMEAVAAGHLTAGIFPEPVASVGELNGLTKLVHSDVPAESMTIIAFTPTALNSKAEEIGRLNRVYAQAAQALRENPDLARQTLQRHIPNLPAAAIERAVLPEYGDPHLPSDSFIAEIIAWTEHTTGRSLTVSPADIIDRGYLPE